VALLRLLLLLLLPARFLSSLQTHLQLLLLLLPQAGRLW
jgi:hypothetical protein